MRGALHSANPLPLRGVLLRLLRTAYVESEAAPQGLRSHPLMLQLMEDLHTELWGVQWRLPWRSLRRKHQASSLIYLPLSEYYRVSHHLLTTF